jgi:thiosulfate/3-mercaptopyruvate sulfurtransferase
MTNPDGAHTTLVSTGGLADHLADPAWVVVDCRFDLAGPASGERQYREAHIPGAIYGHLDRDLSGTKTGRNGRHPLPDPDRLRETFGRWGIAEGVQVAAYDQQNGMFASRLWWLLRASGHQAVAVLDGGFAKWIREGRPTRGGIETVAPRTFPGTLDRARWLDIGQMEDLVRADRGPIVDARAPERYAGRIEPLDPVAGHIPGAVNHFFQRNLAEDGTFLPPDALRAEWTTTLGGAAPAEAVVYCGSGVSACHNLLGLAHAGLDGARLYAGSWSEWCSDGDRPAEREV